MIRSVKFAKRRPKAKRSFLVRWGRAGDGLVPAAAGSAGVHASPVRTRLAGVGQPGLLSLSAPLIRPGAPREQAQVDEGLRQCEEGADLLHIHRSNTAFLLWASVVAGLAASVGAGRQSGLFGAVVTRSSVTPSSNAEATNTGRSSNTRRTTSVPASRRATAGWMISGSDCVGCPPAACSTLTVHRPSASHSTCAKLGSAFTANRIAVCRSNRCQRSHSSVRRVGTGSGSQPPARFRNRPSWRQTAHHPGLRSSTVIAH